MFDDEPITPAMLGVLWPMANEPGWQRKWGIVTFVGSFLEGTWLEGADVATMIGCDTRRARVQLLELTNARILERDGGGGDRKFWYRVNPNWRVWRVRWRYDLREVEQRLAWWEQRASRHPLDAISARPNGARYSKISARLMARAADEWARANDPIARAPMARANSTSGGVDNQLARAIGARANSTGSARPGARANPGPAPVVEISTSRDGEGSTTEPRRPKDGPGWGPVKKALYERCIEVGGKGKFLNPELSRLLRVLIDRHGVDEVLAAIAVVPTGIYGPPVFMDALEDVLESDGPTGVGAGVEPAGLSVEAKLVRVRQQIANYEKEGCPVPDLLQAELEALAGTPLPGLGGGHAAAG